MNEMIEIILNDFAEWIKTQPVYIGGKAGEKEVLVLRDDEMNSAVDVYLDENKPTIEVPETDKELNEKIETYKNAYRIMSDAFENEVRKNKRPQGKWIPTVIDTGLFEGSVCREWQCSNCGEVVKMKYPFCHCGAAMRVKDELNRVKDELEEGENE